MKQYDNKLCSTKWLAREHTNTNSRRQNWT